MKKTFVILTVCTIALLTQTFTFTTDSVNAQKKRQQVQTLPMTPQALVQSLQQTTQQMLDIFQRAQRANDASRRSLMKQLASIAGSRRELMLELLQRDPNHALQLALPDSLLAALPQELQSYFERRVELDGELEVLFEDGQSTSSVHRFLQTNDKRVELHFRGNDSADFVSGQALHVRGLQVGEALIVEEGQTDQTTKSSAQLMQQAAVVASTGFGGQNVLLILVNFQDEATQPYTIADAQNVMTSTSAYYNEASYGQTWLNGTVTGWYTIPVSSTTCNTSSIATYAKQAAQAAGFNLSNYNRLVYAFPNAACGWAGYGTIGGSPSQAWINGTLNRGTLAHELGHGFGLYHSRYLDCHPNIIGTIGSGCTYAEYGDSVDVMGIVAKGGHFNAYQKSRLGWLNYNLSPPIVTVSSSGTYTIDAYETANGNPKALKILKSTDASTGAKTWYWVEVRKPIGFDGFVSSNSNLLGGVVFHQQSDASAAENYLLDMTPGSSSLQFDPALLVGQSFTDPNAGVTFTVVSVSSTSAAVNVSFGPQPCIRANPTVSISPSTTQWIAPGATVNYQVSITNNDSVGCSASAFNLQAPIPVGWLGSLDSSTVALGPASNATTTLHVSSPLSAASGYYNVGVSAANSVSSSYAGSASVVCSILSGLNVTVVADQANYTSNQSATVRANVTSGGAAVSGATVAFTITKPDGTKATSTTTSASTGSATFKYRFGKKDPAGTYQVSVAANWNGSLGSAVTSFTLTR